MLGGYGFQGQVTAGDGSDKQGKMGAGYNNLRRKNKKQQCKVGREEEGSSSNRPELAAFFLALRNTLIEEPLLYLCDNQSLLKAPKEQQGNTQDIRTRIPNHLSSGCTDPQKKEKLCKKRTPTGVSPLPDLYNHSPESKKRLQRSTICIFGSDSTPLGLLSQSYTNALPSLQTDGIRHPQGNRGPSLNHPGTDTHWDHISVYEYLPIHGRQSHGTKNRYVDHDGELDKQTKKQPNYNAGGPKLCTPGLPMGLRTTS